MKIAVINGTEVKGCTYHIKEEFLMPLRDKHEIIEFYLPRDLPHFCCGCKACIFHNDNSCPHAASVEPIWSAMMDANLIVLTAPVYVLGIPAALKALFDQLVAHWMPHRPEPAMFTKRAVIMTNSVGPSFLARSSQRDAVDALSWMGVSKIKRFAVGLLEGVIWNELSEKRRERIIRKARQFGLKYTTIRPAGKSLKTRLKFLMCKTMRKAVIKNEPTPGADSRYWLERGWVKP